MATDVAMASGYGFSRWPDGRGKRRAFPGDKLQDAREHSAPPATGPCFTKHGRIFYFEDDLQAGSPSSLASIVPPKRGWRDQLAD